MDVLGPEVAVLHERPLAADATRLPLDSGALPAGVYVVRAVEVGLSVARRFTVR